MKLREEIVMKNRKNNLNKKTDNIEDSTKNSEFISSFFSWNTLEGQKEKVRELENITKQKKRKQQKKRKIKIKTQKKREQMNNIKKYEIKKT